ncbi:MAG: type II toxin-antitoxin system VapB family antitoxin [Verrucomicrobia bacterium]|nr:MAG: type II toxin-antitoxin system VapB family antitoxin [Verrucomicrobiota bacterium]
MRTTLDLPKNLVDEALKVSHLKTKTALIITALEEFVRKSRIQELKSYKGKIDLDIDLDSLRDRR